MNDEINTYIVRILDLIKTDDNNKIYEIWNTINIINNIINTHTHWQHLKTYQKEEYKNKLQSQIMTLIYPLWITDTLVQKDIFFHNKIQQISSIMTPSFLEITLPQERYYLIENATNEIRNLDSHYFDSPIKLLCFIYESFNSITVALKTTDNPNIEIDYLISTFVYVIIQAQPKNIISICQWIDEMSNPNISRSDELFYIYTHLLVCVSYIYNFHPTVTDSVKSYMYSLPPYYISDYLTFFPKSLFQSLNLFHRRT